LSIIEVNKEKILKDYPSIRSFIKDYGLTNPHFYAIVSKKQWGFQEGSRSYKVFKKMEAGGYLKRNECIA
jgi:hypothetical protein